MSTFTKLFVTTIAAAFYAIAAWAVARGAYKPGVAAFVFGSLVALIGAIGWFEHKYPLPPAARNPPSLLGEASRYLDHHPGWPGRIAAAFLGGLAVFGVLVLVLRAIGTP